MIFGLLQKARQNKRVVTGVGEVVPDPPPHPGGGGPPQPPPPPPPSPDPLPDVVVATNRSNNGGGTGSGIITALQVPTGGFQKALLILGSESALAIDPRCTSAVFGPSQTPMTKHAEFFESDTGRIVISSWYLDDPPPGSNDTNFFFANGNPSNWVGIVALLQNVAPGPPVEKAEFGILGASINNTIETIEDGLFLLEAAALNDPSTPVKNGTTQNVFFTLVRNVAQGMSLGFSRFQTTEHGPFNFGWAGSSTGRAAQIIMGYRKDGPTPPPPPPPPPVPPVVTGFNVTPTTVTVGQQVTARIDATGDITSATLDIDGAGTLGSLPVSVNVDIGGLSFPVEGVHVPAAEVTGPGGTVPVTAPAVTVSAAPPPPPPQPPSIQRVVVDKTNVLVGETVYGYVDPYPNSPAVVSAEMRYGATTHAVTPSIPDAFVPAGAGNFTVTGALTNADGTSTLVGPTIVVSLAPAAVPIGVGAILSLDFKAGMPGGVTFTRSGSAFDDRGGTVATFGNNVPRRIAAKGLLIEKGDTSVLANSSDISAWTLASATVTGGQTDPQVATNGRKLIASVATAEHKATSPMFNVGPRYRPNGVLVYAKAAGLTRCYAALIKNGDPTHYMRTDLTLSGGGTAVLKRGGPTHKPVFHSLDAKIKALSSGWYGIKLRGIPELDDETTACQLVLGLQDASGNDSFLGNGTDGVTFWGSQPIANYDEVLQTHGLVAGSPITRSDESATFDPTPLNIATGCIMVQLPDGPRRHGTVLDTTNGDRAGLGIMIDFTGGWNLRAKIGDVYIQSPKSTPNLTEFCVAWNASGVDLLGATGSTVESLATIAKNPGTPACGASARIGARMNGTYFLDNSVGIIEAFNVKASPDNFLDWAASH